MLRKSVTGASIRVPSRVVSRLTAPPVRKAGQGPIHTPFQSIDPESTFDEGDICEVLDAMVPLPAEPREASRPEPTRVTVDDVHAALAEAVQLCMEAEPRECAAYWDAAEELFYVYKRQMERDARRAAQKALSELESREYDL